MKVRLPEELLVLLIPFGISISPWILYIAIRPANLVNSDLEGALFLCGFIGTLSFTSTGPVAGMMLAAFRGNSALSFRKFAGFFLLVSLPILTFEIFVPSGSIVVAFTGGPWTVANTSQMFASAAIVGGLFYAAYLGISFQLAKRSLAIVNVGAALLFIGSWAIIAMRLIPL
jgi:hypothetical protein